MLVHTCTVQYRFFFVCVCVCKLLLLFFSFLFSARTYLYCIHIALVNKIRFWVSWCWLFHWYWYWIQIYLNGVSKNTEHNFTGLEALKYVEANQLATCRQGRSPSWTRSTSSHQGQVIVAWPNCSAFQTPPLEELFCRSARYERRMPRQEKAQRIRPAI